MTVTCRHDIHTVQEPGSHILVSCSDELAVHMCPPLYLQRQVGKLSSGFFYDWALLRKNYVATDVHFRSEMIG